MFVFTRYLLPPLFLYLSLILALPSTAEDALAWSLGPDVYREIDAADLEELAGSAYQAGVPIELISAANKLLFDESRPEEIPDIIHAKKRFYALAIAQERINEPGDSDRPSDDAIRMSAIAAVDALGCRVVPKKGDTVPSVAQEYVGPLTAEQEQQMLGFLDEFDAYVARLEAGLANPPTEAPEGEIELEALPEQPDIMSEARARYENLEASAKREVQEALRREALAGFSCEGSGSGNGVCEPGVVFEIEEELVEGTPMQLKYRVRAAPSCTFGGSP